MIYRLTCGTCAQELCVQADTQTVIWECPNCFESSVTSVPTTPEGELETDLNATGSLINPLQATGIIVNSEPFEVS